MATRYQMLSVDATGPDPARIPFASLNQKVNNLQVPMGVGEMSRIVRLAVVALGVAILGAPGSALQPLPQCNLAKARYTLAQHLQPSFRGCTVAAVRSLLRPYRIEMVFEPGPSPADTDIVTGQAGAAPTITFFVARAGSQTQDPDPPPTPPPPAETTVEFAIADSPAIVEGNELSFKIIRKGDNGRPHRVFIAYPDETPFIKPPKFIDFAVAETERILAVRTAADPAVNGDRTVEVGISEVQGGKAAADARVAHGVITDASPPPPPEQSRYAIRLEQEAVRGQPLAFLVTRTGPLPRAEIPYSIAQDGQSRPGAIAMIIEENEVTAPLPLSAAEYDACGGPVQVSLLGVSGEVVAMARLSGAPPLQCRETPPTRDPWWPWVVGAIVTIAVGGWTWKRWHPPEPDPDMEEAFVNPSPGPEAEAPPPAPAISADCSIKPGPATLELKDAAIGRWPPVETKVTFERGIARVPEPLPIAETEDG